MKHSFNCSFLVTERFYNRMTHKENSLTHTHTHTFLNTPVLRHRHHYLEETTTEGDTERRQPNAASITTE